MEFGLRLYEKKAGLLVLTQAGRTVLPYFEQLLSQRDAARKALEDWKQTPRGVVRIGCGPAFSSHLLPRLLRSFRRRYPEIEVYLETGDSHHLVHGLQSGSLDLTFDVSSVARESRRLTALYSWDAPYGLVSALPQLPSQCSLKDLAGVPFILFRKDSAIDRMIEQYFESHSFVPRAVMRSDSAEAIKSMVEAGLGIALVALWAVRDEIRSKKLSVIRLREKPPQMSMSLFRGQAAYIPRSLQAFIDEMTKHRFEHLVPAGTVRKRPFTPGES